MPNQPEFPEVDNNQLVSDLEELIALPSVAFPGFPDQPVSRAAELTKRIFEDSGVEDVQLIAVPGAPSTVFADIPAPQGAEDLPSVLLYAHYDVQPAGPEEAWQSPAFQPTVRDGRLYGRGSADDKWAIALHAAVLRAFDGKPPVGVKVLIEGDEETGRGTLTEFVAANPERFKSDLFVIADTSNVSTGKPTLTTSLRGVVVVDVTVKTLKSPVHSGEGGGPAPDALIALSRIIASLHNDDGSIAIEGLDQLPWEGSEVDPAEYAAKIGLLEGVDLIGNGSIAEQVYAGPAITAIGIDAPAVDVAANAILPEAKARLSCRLAPTQDPAVAAELIAQHVLAHAPWNVQVEIEKGPGAVGALLAGAGPGSAAAAKALEIGYGLPAVKDGSGGAIPLCADLAGIFPDAEFILWGASDDQARMHAGDESIDLEDLGRHAAAEVALLALLAQR